MIKAPISEDEAERLASLKRMNILSIPREADIDRIVRITRKFFRTEIALVSLIGEEKLHFISCDGAEPLEVAREISFCAHAILQDDVFVVSDATTDERFHGNPMVAGPPNIRFYAGQPLANSDGFRIGTLCILSPEPRKFTVDDADILLELARMVEVVLENRDRSDTQAVLVGSLAAAERAPLIDPLSGIWNRRGLEALFAREISRATRQNIPVAVALVAIDHCDQPSDGTEPRMDDTATKLAARLLSDAVRATDVVACYDRGTFALILPGIYPMMVPAVGDKIMRVFRQKARLASAGGGRTLTLSAGFTVAFPRRALSVTAASIFEAADATLRTARAAGGDCYEISGVSNSLLSSLALA
jgi:diguanylate cyclase (GGDEF)-like protein